MMKIAIQGIVLLGVLSVSLHSAKAEMVKYASIKPLLIQAIDDLEGKASGILTGNVASYLRKATHSNLPLMANVTTVGVFSQPGCKRLNLHLSQPGVVTTSGEKKNFDLAYGINFCRDGDIPRMGSKYKDLN